MRVFVNVPDGKLHSTSWVYPWIESVSYTHLRSTRARMDEIKNTPGMNLTIRYIMDRETRQPIVIPDSQMRSCIAVSGTYDQAVLYL